MATGIFGVVLATIDVNVPLAIGAALLSLLVFVRQTVGVDARLSATVRQTVVLAIDTEEMTDGVTVK